MSRSTLSSGAPLGALSRLLLLLVLAGLSACGPDRQHVRIKGHFRGVNQAEFYLYDEMGSPASVDTVRLDNGRFEIEKPINERRVLNLLFPNFTELNFIAEPGKTIDIEADANNLAEVDIAGSKDNEWLTQLRHDNVGRTEGDKRLAAADFIRQHPGAVASQAVFMTYFAKPDQLQPPAAELLNLMLHAQPRNSSMRALHHRLMPLAQTAPGQPVPALELTDIQGRTFRLSPVAGRPTVVLFWASWSKNLYGLMRIMRQAARTYGPQLNIVCISLDYDIRLCRMRAERDTIPGHVVCDGRAFRSPAVSRLGVTGVPSVLLIDEHGRIRSRLLRTDNLLDDIDRLVN